MILFRFVWSGALYLIARSEETKQSELFAEEEISSASGFAMIN